MANVKLNRKDLLDELQAKLVLDLRLKISQQELLDKCIEFAVANITQFITQMVSQPILTKEKIEKILSHAISGKLYDLDKTDDELIYGL
jgi:uncharacterized protein (DUF1778 family)